MLISRRPDIEHLPLTCENTNTALPYIDVVNETLEYLIANSSQGFSLNGYLGHGTDGVASEDLLASPQFVIDSAYTTLRDERFPARRRSTTPWRTSDATSVSSRSRCRLPWSGSARRMTSNAVPTSYGWRDILMEEVGLSAESNRNSHRLEPPAPLWRMYGFPDGTGDAAVITGLSNARQFARRMDISYNDLVSLLQARFINPNRDLIPKLERLGASFATLRALKDGTITDASFDSLLASLAVPPIPRSTAPAPTSRRG